MSNSLSPEDLAWLRQCAAVDGNTYDRLLLHLLERVEALEQRPIPGTVELAAPTPGAAPVATNKEQPLPPHIAITYQPKSVYKPLRPAQPAPSAAYAGGLVERVATAMQPGTFDWRVYRDACASGDKSTIFAAAIAWHCEASWMASRRAKESHLWADVAAKAADCVHAALKELKSEGL